LQLRGRARQERASRKGGCKFWAGDLEKRPSAKRSKVKDVVLPEKKTVKYKKRWIIGAVRQAGGHGSQKRQRQASQEGGTTNLVILYRERGRMHFRPPQMPQAA